MLVHDWVSAKTEEDQPRRNSLFELITNLNKAELNSVSVMLTGEAQIIGEADEKYTFLKSLHLNNDTIDPDQIEYYVRDDGNELVLISLKSCKITDTHNKIEEY